MSRQPKIPTVEDFKRFQELNEDKEFICLLELYDDKKCFIGKTLACIHDVPHNKITKKIRDNVEEFLRNRLYKKYNLDPNKKYYTLLAINEIEKGKFKKWTNK